MKTKHITAAILALAASAAQAAPFAITYQGTISNSTIPGIHNGQRYTLTLVMDHGNPVFDSASWEPQMLTCAIWRMNDAGNAVFAQDLSPLASPPTAATGAITTNGAGVLTGMFTGISSSPAGPDFSSSGFTHPAPLHWFANGSNSVLRDGAAIRSFDDVAGGVQMNPASWLLAPYGGGPCAAPVAPGVPPTPVPTLGHAALALLALLVGLTGGARRRAQRRQRG